MTIPFLARRRENVKHEKDLPKSKMNKEMNTCQVPLGVHCPARGFTSDARPMRVLGCQPHQPLCGGELRLA